MEHSSHATVVYPVTGIRGLYLKKGTGAHAERIHAHREHSIGIVRHGATTVLVPGREYRLEENHCVYIPPGIPHLCSPDKPDEFSFEVVYWTEEVNRALGLTTEGKIAAGALKAGRYRIYDDEDLPGPEFFIQETLARCRLNPEWQEGPFASALDEDAQKDIRAIESRFRGYRQSRRKYGVGLHGLAQNLQIEKAKTLLREGYSVADTAAESGFCDQSHFVRVFRLYTGLRPIDFK
jgi:hypothetical protein